MPYSKALDAKIDVVAIKDVLDSELWECTRDQANVLVRDHRGEAWRIWLVEEVDKYLLAGPQEIQSIIDRKKQKPGPYLK